MKADVKQIAILYAGATHWGGVETYLEQLFININKNKISLTLLSIGGWELCERLSKSGYEVKIFDNKWYDAKLIWQIAQFLNKNNFSLITGQGMVANFYSRLAAKKAGIPNLITIHSDYKFDYKGYKRFLYGISFKLFEKYTTKYITVSHFLRKEAIKLGVDESKITVVYNGVKEIFATPKKREGTVIFGSLGRLHYKKGYQGLIKAANIIRELDFKIYIWGSGEDKNELEEMIKTYNLSDKVILRGFTTDIPKSLSEIDIYIQPSLEEGFGITVAEGMYAERPVIVTPAGSLPELVTNNVTGLISKDFTPQSITNVMKKLIKDEELSHKLAVAGRRKALERFGLDKWIGQIEKTYLDATTED